jgi:hypothetical protein
MAKIGMIRLALASMVALAVATGLATTQGLFTASPEGASASTTRADATAAAGRSQGNPPWYPSLAAFEHYDSARTKLFPTAYFGGSFGGPNRVQTRRSKQRYPSGWNVTYLNAGNAFLYGGGNGDEASTIGPYVAKVNPRTLKPIWYRQLANTARSGAWDYPGTLALMDDGFLYVIYGPHLAKINPRNGRVVGKVALPTGGASGRDTAYNGFDATPDGIIVAKSIYRRRGCTLPGPSALFQCPDRSDVPSSVLSTINRKTMKVSKTVTMPGEVIGRVTVGSYKGREYAYFFTVSEGLIRYEVGRNGSLRLDRSWRTGPLLTPGQTPAWAALIMGDWILTQSNGLPASAPMSVFAVHQGNAARRLSVQPFAGDPVPPQVKRAYGELGPGGTQAESFMPAGFSADPSTRTVYAMDALPGEIAAIKLTPSGLRTVWKVKQATTEFIAMIGRPQRRVLVATEVPRGEIPGRSRHDKVVWRSTATGRALARSPRLPAITSGSMVQPYYGGGVFYPGDAGALYRLQP